MKLTTRGLKYSYGDHSVLSDIDFEIQTGEIVGLVAPSGYGKTTFAKILAGYQKPKGGRVEMDVPRENGYNPVQLILQHPEQAVDPKWMMKKTVQESWEPPQELYDIMGIKDEWLKRYPNELSGGEIQRFCVIRALNPKTKFLIADEMTTMLDAITTAQIWQVVVERARKGEIGLLVISHEVNMLAHLCDRIVDLKELQENA